MAESSSPSDFAFRAFISYSHRDKAWADWLHKSLETYRVPLQLAEKQTAHGTIPRRLHPIFRDREELASATDLGRKVNEALAQSQNLIVICSPASATSRWVNEEVLSYKRMGRGERIFCLIVDGEPNASDLPGRETEACFCPALRFRLDANGQPTTERTEPIAADARPGKDGKANARLKLIAGMLDVGFDALKQREQQRRVRRMTAIAAAALVIMSVTIVLATFALISRHDAVIAQHKAVDAQQVAERRQKQAEGLVGFMLGDLNDKLEEVKRLDIVQSVDDKAMAYFAALPPTDVNDTALEQRARAMEKIGLVRMESNNLPGALEAFRASVQVSSKLASSRPTDVARQVAYSRTLAYSGMTHWNLGELDAAHADFENARRVLESSLERAPNDLSLLEQLTFVDDDIAHVLEARGQPDAALALYREELELDRKLVAAKPRNDAYLGYVGAAQNNLARLALQRGDLVAAIDGYRADDAIETRLSSADSKDNSRRDSMMVSRATLGRTLALAGMNGEAIRYLQQAVDIGAQLVKFAPDVHDFQTDFALYSQQLARLKRADGDPVSARALTANAVAGFSTLIRAAPDDANLQKFSAEAAIEQATESLAAGHVDAAAAQVRGALQILEPMLARHPDKRDTLLPTMQARLLLASVSADRQATQALREQALQTMQAVKVDRGDPRLLALQVEALLALDRESDAQPLIRQLRNEGYRDPEFVALMQRAGIAYSDNPAMQARLLAAAKSAPVSSSTQAAK